MDNIAKMTIMGLMIIVLFVGLNHLADTRMEQYIRIDRCVADKSMQENYNGSYEGAWVLFAEDCGLTK
jgi:hypothetical protein